jgi:hypothetical protein
MNFPLPTSDLSLALRAGPPAAKPVAQARSAVQRFYTKDLKGEDKTLAAVEDYIVSPLSF